jgi:hypothetical protein
MQRTPNSRLVINEVLNSSAYIAPASPTSCSYLTPPSESLTKRQDGLQLQSAMPSVGNVMTWSTFSLFGGKERSGQEYVDLLQSAGFKVIKVWPFRTFTSMMEAVVV